MPKFFSNITGAHVAALFEIRLESDIVILRGGEHDAASQMLKGVVVLCLPAAAKVQDVHLRMTGRLKKGWMIMREPPSPAPGSKVGCDMEIFNHKWAPFVGGAGTGSSSSKAVTLPAGNYEWPFELIIPGDTAESVEGLSDNYLKYHLKATVARGKLAQDLHAYKPIRIVRTLDPAALELSHAMTVENVWPNKIEYSIVIPQKAVVFGSAISLEMRFTSLLKGLRIGSIKCQLLESQDIMIPATSSTPERNKQYSRQIETWAFDLNDEEHYHDMLHDTGADGYLLKEILPLPKKLSLCRQDVDTGGIKIRHKVKFSIALLNPDGHVSELRATLPVTIFISPNMPLDADGSLVDQTPSALASGVESHAPPLYGEHQLDQLYAGIDSTGLMTPAPQSGMNTPFYGQSRSGSHDNLSTMAGAHTTGSVPPAALSSRLQNLNTTLRNGSHRGQSGHESGTSTPHPAPHHESELVGYFDNGNHGHSRQSSNPLSRRVSEEEHHEGALSPITGAHTPEHVDYSNLGDLSKVPSYSTAIRAPARGMSYTNVLPNYAIATSTPPSPVLGPTSSASSYSDTSSIPPLHGPTPRSNPLSSMGFTPIHPPAPVHTGDTDERRRLHILRQRERSS